MMSWDRLARRKAFNLNGEGFKREPAGHHHRASTPFNLNGEGFKPIVRSANCCLIRFNLNGEGFKCRKNCHHCSPTLRCLVQNKNTEFCNETCRA